MIIGDLEVTSKVCFDHAMNSWADRRGGLLFRQDYEGYQFPEEKPLLLERIREGLAVDESMHVHARRLMAAQSFERLAERRPFRQGVCFEFLRSLTFSGIPGVAIGIWPRIHQIEDASEGCPGV